MKPNQRMFRQLHNIIEYIMEVCEYIWMYNVQLRRKG